NHSARIVQADGLADLVEHELALAFKLGRGEALGAAGHLDGIDLDHSRALQELAEGEFEAVVEAPENRSIALIARARRIEMEYLGHASLYSNETWPDLRHPRSAA